MNDKLHDVIQVTKDIYNRDISQYDESFLIKSLNNRLAADNSSDNYSTYLSENSNEANEFYESLNITYSEFFRNSLNFALLEQLIIPSIFEEKKKSGSNEIRIWSTACAGGQEAYSLAIILDELICSRDVEINYRIFATDISDSELKNARRGIYNDISVQQVRLKHLKRYFTPVGELYQIVDKFKDKIDFSNYNLLDPNSSCPPMSIFGDFDLVICSNILFYYRPDIRQQMLNKVYNCLSPKGYLMTGEAERDIIAKNDSFYPVIPAAAIFRKRNY